MVAVDRRRLVAARLFAVLVVQYFQRLTVEFLQKAKVYMRKLTIVKTAALALTLAIGLLVDFLFWLLGQN